jgi:PBP1b-binding outer membrane lipoprotein LpoB
MKYLVLVLLLAGCTTVPVARKFPDAPTQLLEKCPQLKTIAAETTVFSVLTKTVVENYTTYHECATLQRGWIEWYNTQKKVFEQVK